MTVLASLSTGKNGSVLVVGATGFIGKYVAEASLLDGRPTFILVRPGLLCSSKLSTIKALQDKGAIILHGLINDREGMEKILRENEIDIVISAVGGESIVDQFPLVEAMKNVGTIKKRKVRRAIEESGVPYTYICCNSIASWPYFDNTHPSEVLPPLDQFKIYGDGSVKENIIPQSVVASFTHDIFIKGCQVNFSIDGPSDVDVGILYPEETFRTLDECFTDFFLKLGDNAVDETQTKNPVHEPLPITASCG
ncbi:hypothetical protein FEM48_Zijuj10G0151200 [Ziziphus jujuba var. spinosa]|uniref:NmrA-like domain-containing protein n=1 Tax=Ziziphus jujuba var. spinosa TaxID=714518 RepID=A0A978UP37_ZIZJJ|nr:hypothetical protein FEM48_Zijuj10G0151200 [Ziziphus jujuba var. spinosa]